MNIDDKISVQNALKRLKTGKATGCDGIDSELLKYRKESNK